VLIYIFTFTSFGVILILGGVRFATVEVAIFRQAASLGNLAMAAALSLVQISFMLLLMAVYTRLQRHTVVDLQGTSQIAQAPKNLREWILVITNTTVMCILLFAPLLTLVFSSLTAGGELTLRHYQNLATNPRESVLFVPPTQAIANSLIFAVMATVMSVALGLLTAYLLAQSRKSAARWLDPLFMMPLATSAVTLGFGFIISLDRPPLNLRTSPILIPIAHTLVALPFVVRSILPAIHSIAPGIRESANVLGASGWQVWRLIDLPLIARGLVVGATFAFTISMGEFGASLFIARPDTPTMPVIIYRLISQPGLANYGQALAMSVLLMVVCGISFFTIERLRQAGIGEF
jgi:thiamine transport system permease protein